MLVQAGVVALQGMGYSPYRAAREDHDFESACAQFSCALHGRLAAFHHVGQQRDAVRKLLASCVHLLGRAQRFYEQGVHAAFQITLGALQGGFQTFGSYCVGAGQNQG